MFFFYMNFCISPPVYRYCGCGGRVKQKYIAVDSMYSSVAKAQDDLDAAIAELKYIVERAPQNCYF